MTLFIEAAWLISVPIFLIIRAVGRNVWNAPMSGPANVVLIAISILTIVTAIGSQCGIAPLLFGTPLFPWSGFLLLCFFWARGIYLFCSPVQKQTSTGA